MYVSTTTSFAISSSSTIPPNPEGDASDVPEAAKSDASFPPFAPPSPRPSGITWVEGRVWGWGGVSHGRGAVGETRLSRIGFHQSVQEIDMDVHGSSDATGRVGWR